MQLASRGPQLLARLPAESFSAELQRTTVETNTRVCNTLDELREDIAQLRARLIATAAEEGLGVAAVGTPPGWARVCARRPRGGPAALLGSAPRRSPRPTTSASPRPDVSGGCSRS